MIDVLSLLFPRKCVLCHRILTLRETDLCTHCRIHCPEFSGQKKRISFVADWTALWYYKDDARDSLKRYKFHGIRSNARPYGRLLSMKLLQEEHALPDIITWVPISYTRRRHRGYDQDALLAHAIAEELNQKAVSTLKKRWDNPPQSSFLSAAQRKANVLNVYRVAKPTAIQGKNVLLLDDIITTGATASECARMLLMAGAKSVTCAAVAAAADKKK